MQRRVRKGSRYINFTTDVTPDIEKKPGRNRQQRGRAARSQPSSARRNGAQTAP